MPDQETRQAILDEEHLKLLSIGYYVSAGFLALGSLFSLFYFGMGMFMLIGGQTFPHTVRPGEPPVELMGSIFIGLGLAMFILMILGAVFKLLAGLRIRQRRSRVFCMVIAGISCLEFPYGTLLGICTFIVLGRKSVQMLFETAPGRPEETQQIS